MKLSPCYHFSCATAKFSVLLARFLKGLSMFFISCATSLILSRNTPISILSNHSTETTLPVTAHGSLVSSFKTRCQVRSLLWLEASSVCPSFWEQTHAWAMQYQGLCDPPLARSALCLPWNSFPTSLSSCAFLQPYQPLCCFWKHTKRISLNMHLYLLLPRPRMTQINFCHFIREAFLDYCVSNSCILSSLPRLSVLPLLVLTLTTWVFIDYLSHYKRRSWK